MSNAKAHIGDCATFTPPGQFSFLRIPVVLKRRGVSRSAHYSDIKSGLYPKPVSIGPRAVAHPDYEVDALNAATVAEKSDAEKRALVLMLVAARKATTCLAAVSGRRFIPSECGSLVDRPDKHTAAPVVATTPRALG